MNSKIVLMLIVLSVALLATISLQADERECESNEIFKDNLCWFRADKKLSLKDAESFCADEDGRLPTMAEARSLLEQYKGKKVRELGQMFDVSGPFFFWVQQEPGSNKTSIVLPGTSATMDLDPTSKLFAQCVRKPGKNSSWFGF